MEKKIIDYRVVKNGSSFDIGTDILLLISKGYYPLGGVCVVSNDGRLIHYQAMVKYESWIFGFKTFKNLNFNI